MASIHDHVTIGPVEVANRLYRAPLLEVAGNRPDAAAILQRELAPSAEGGAGLIFQGACIVTPEGGRTAPGLSRFHDRDFVVGLRPAVEEVQRRGARLFVQLGHGGLQCMETWHAAYRDAHPGLETLAVSDPPWWFRGLVAGGFLRLPNLRVMTGDDLEDLAEAFGRAAGHAHEAGYDGIHLAGSNASIFQQLWSPVFNRRTDSFGGDTIAERGEFMRRVVTSIRRHTRPDYPVTAKVPAETAAPAFVRGALSVEDCVEIARVCRDAGVDAVAPVRVGVTRDQSVARGRFPAIAWSDPRFTDGYRDAFGSTAKAAVVREANRAAAALLPFEPTWNAGLCGAVKRAVGDDVVVLCEGGVRERAEIDRILADGDADMVGMARPFYAEPHIARRILREHGAGAICGSCNNCTIPQVTGAVGVCRTPDVMAERGRLQKEGAYDE